MGAKAVIFAKRVGHGRQRALQVVQQHRAVGHIVGHLAHPVHIVRKTDQAGGNIGNHFERAADHRGAADLSKRADMRQAGWAIAGFKQHITLGGRGRLVAFQQCPRLFKRPCLAGHACGAQLGHRVCLSLGGALCPHSLLRQRECVNKHRGQQRNGPCPTPPR